MNRLGDRLAVCAEGVLDTQQQTCFYSYRLFTPHPTLDVSLTISQHNSVPRGLSCALGLDDHDGVMSYTLSQNTRLLGNVCVEITTGDETTHTMIIHDAMLKFLGEARHPRLLVDFV